MTPKHTVAQLCAALGVTRSGYHAWLKASPSARQSADLVLVGQITQPPPAPAAIRRSSPSPGAASAGHSL